MQGPGRVRHQAQGLLVFGLTWAMTAGGLGLLHLVDASPGTTAATAVLGVATGLSTLVRFVAMRSWMFRPVPTSPGGGTPSPLPVPTSPGGGGGTPSRADGFVPHPAARSSQIPRVR